MCKAGIQIEKLKNLRLTEPWNCDVTLVQYNNLGGCYAYTKDDADGKLRCSRIPLSFEKTLELLPTGEHLPMIPINEAKELPIMDCAPE